MSHFLLESNRDRQEMRDRRCGTDGKMRDGKMRDGKMRDGKM